jgi:hypothetical protein
LKSASRAAGCRKEDAMGYGRILSIGDSLDGREHVVTTVETETHTVTLEIDVYQQCCEDFGHFASEDDYADYVGADLLEVRTVDADEISLDVGDIPEEAQTCFVNFETSVGTLQFAVYNDHNGYYGHGVRIEVADKTTGKTRRLLDTSV